MDSPNLNAIITKYNTISLPRSNQTPQHFIASLLSCPTRWTNRIAHSAALHLRLVAVVQLQFHDGTRRFTRSPRRNATRVRFYFIYPTQPDCCRKANRQPASMLTATKSSNRLPTLFVLALHPAPPNTRSM